MSAWNSCQLGAVFWRPGDDIRVILTAVSVVSVENVTTGLRVALTVRELIVKKHRKN